MSNLRPGNDGDLVPSGTRLFRIARRTKLSPEALRQGKASAEMFELSSEDKESEAKRLSVWAEELTVADQAWGFLGSKPDQNVVLCLSVDKINAIRSQTGFAPIRVEWEQALLNTPEGGKVTNTRPGAEGHAGIAGLAQGGNGKVHREQRKAMRSDLADASVISPVPVPHEIPEVQLREAAYYISINEHNKHLSQDECWTSAIRQLRRALVHHGSVVA